MQQWIRNTVKRWLNLTDARQVGLVHSPNLTGIHLDEDGSLAIPAVMCAVSTISSLIAGLPLALYQQLNQGANKREAPEHPLYDLLRYSPNPETSDVSHWETVMVHTLLWGNSYAEIERDEAGRPVALWLLDPARMRVCRDPEYGTYYEYKTQEINPTVLRPDQVFHVAGLSRDGITGLPPITLARQSLSLTSACETFGAAFFGNSAKPAGVLETASVLSDNARENLRKSFESLYSGASNAGRTVVLEEGLTFTPVGISAEDAQFLETRKHQITEVSRIFRLPPVFIFDMSAATWGNLETLNRQLVQITLMPWLNKIEAQIRQKLLSEDERTKYFAEHDLTNLLRADTLTRYQSYESGIRAGWLLRSECRAAERLDPVENLDKPTLPANVIEEGSVSPSEQQPVGDQGDVKEDNGNTI